MNEDPRFPTPPSEPYWYSGDDKLTEMSDARPQATSFSTSVPPPPPPLSATFTLGQRPPVPGRLRLVMGVLAFILVLLVIGGIVSGVLIALRPHRSTGSNTSTTQSNTGGSNSAAQTDAGSQTTFSVASHPLVIIDNQSKSISVHTGGASDRVVLQATSNPGSAGIPYDETSDNHTIVITVSSADSFDLVVTVPATTDLKLDTNDGNIVVDGVSGQMSLISNSGSITVTHSTINAASIINDNSGAIQATQTTLGDHVAISNNTGKITFAGSLDPKGVYAFIGNGGLVDVTLPPDASFHVDATATNSTVSSDFPGVSVQNAEIHANVGKAPRASLTLQNNGGTVALHARKGV